MKSTQLMVLLVVLSAATASAQRRLEPSGPRSDDVGPCEAVDGRFGPLRCPNQCGSYYTLTIELCNVDAACDMLIPISTCCGKYSSYTDGGNGSCVFTEMRNPRVKSRILELAEENEILIPTCSGAYVPAWVAFRQQAAENGGL